MEFSRNIKLRAYDLNCNIEGHIHLATNDTSRYLNITGSRNGATSVHPEDARVLRDALLKAYPLEQDVVKECCPFKAAGVGFCGCSMSGTKICRSPGKSLFDKLATLSTVAKWETVADGLDRIKVPGGWLYQNASDEMIFVAEAS